MSQVASTKMDTSVLEFINAKSERFAARPALCMKEADGWREMTYGELHQKAMNFCAYLIELGIQHGDRIALLSESKPEWGVAFFGAIRSGAVLVPLDVKLTESELTNIISDCQPKLILADAKHLSVVENVRAKVASIKNVYCVDRGCSDDKYQSIDALKPSNAHESIERKLDEVALIVYTSGTTGNPKGVMTTFGNLIFQVNSFGNMVHLTENDRYLSILPLNHLLELTGGFLGILNQGGSISFSHSIFPQEIIRTMNERGITGMISVPLFYKSLKGAIEREIRKKGEEASVQFKLGLSQAHKMPIAERAKIFPAIHAQLGGKMRAFISGGAPLDTEVAEFFDLLGIHILQGYGLTETSPVTSGNSIDANRIGSVGRALPGVELKIDKKDPADNCGEVLARGPHIMKGYYKRDDLTKEVIDSDGWFHTGDIGHIDDDGFLFITGRIKNLIVLGGGKKVFPEEVETALAAASSIKELCVCARKSADGFKEGTEEVCAVVIPADAVAGEHKDDKDGMLAIIKKEVDELAQHLAPYKRPTHVLIYDGTELPKTATRKVKRPVVTQWLNSPTNV